MRRRLALFLAASTLGFVGCESKSKPSEAPKPVPTFTSSPTTHDHAPPPRTPEN